MSEANWIPVSQQTPERGQRVEWISPGGIHETGTYQGGVIWFPEGSSMYVYYTPTYWRPAKARGTP